MCRELSLFLEKPSMTKISLTQSATVLAVKRKLYTHIQSQSTYTHSHKNTYGVSSKLFHLFSLLIDFIAPINEYRMSYKKNYFVFCATE